MKRQLSRVRVRRAALPKPARERGEPSLLKPNGIPFLIKQEEKVKEKAGIRTS